MSDGGGLLKIFGPYWDNTNSTVYANIYIYAFDAGTSNAKLFWTDEAKTTSVNNVQGDATGTVSGYFEGTYKIEIRESDGTTVIKTYDNFNLSRQLDGVVKNATSDPSVVTNNTWMPYVKRDGSDNYLGLYINNGTKFFPVTGQFKDVSEYASLSAAITAIGATETTLLISDSQSVSTNETVPATLQLLFLRDGELDIDSGYTVTINGPIRAGLFQIFTGDGSVVFGAGGESTAIATWFGSDTDAIQSAVDTTAPKVYVPAGTWAYGGVEVSQRPAVRLRGDLEIYGDGQEKTIITQNDAYYLFGYGYLSGDGTIDPAANIKNLYFHDFKLLGATTPVFSPFEHLMQLGCVSDVMIERVKFVGFPGDAIIIGEALGSVERHQENVTIQDCYFDGVNNQNRQAISVTDGTDIFILNNYFVNCTDSTMPGNIDFEPNGGTMANKQRIRNVHVIGNTFEESDSAAISVQVQGVDDWETPIGAVFIRGNHVASSCTTDVKLYYTASGTAVTDTDTSRADIFVDNNYFASNGGSVMYGMNVLSITNNKFSNGFWSITLGKNDISYGQAVNVNISDNDFLGTATYPNLLIGQCDNVRINNNRFQTGNSPAAYNVEFYGNGVTVTCSAIQITNNLFYRVAAYGAIPPVKETSATVTAIISANYSQDGWPIPYHPKTFGTLADDGTPTVKEDLPMLTGGTTAITDFIDEYAGQVLYVLAQHSVTITDGAPIQLSGGVNYAMTSGDSLTLVSYGGVWYELSRSVN